MYSTSTAITANIEELQADILLDNLNDNPNFSSSNIANLNKKLNTKKQNVVQALNEVKNTVETLNASVTNSLSQQYEVLGDFMSHPELIDQIKAIDTNLITALTKTNNKINSISATISKTKKDVVFVLPKVNDEASQPEIYFPYRGYLRRVVTSLSSDNHKEAELVLVLEHFKNDEWKELYTMTMDKDRFYNVKNIMSDSIYIDNSALRIRPVQAEGGLKNLTVVATVEVVVD